MLKHKINSPLSIIISLGMLFNSYGNVYASTSASIRHQDVSSQAVAKTLFVDKNNTGGNGCNDAWAGTITQPLCTIDKGLSLLQPGDTLYVRKGNYPSFSVGNSGLAGKYITISGYGDEMPLVKGGQGIELRGTSYVALRGFEVSGATGNWTGGISLTNSNTANPRYNIIEGNKVHGNTYAGMSGIKISEGSYNKILHNEVYDNYFTGIRVSGVSSSITDNEIGYNLVYNHTLAGSDSDGIGLNGITITRTNIHDNIVHDNSDDGIDTWNSTNNIIVGNVSYNHKGVGDGNGFKMGGENGGHNLVKNNIAYNNKARGFDSNGSGGNVYYQNVAYDNTGFGFQDNWRRDSNCTAKTCPGVFINNIGYNNGKGNFSAGTSTLTSHNNIWYSDSGSPKVAYDATVYSSLSEFYAASGKRLDNPNASDLSSLQVNPQFINPAGFQFELMDSSPAIDHGDPTNPGQVSAINRVDIGAFEYGLYTVSVVNVARASADPTNAASVNFTVTFSVPVTGVDKTDFALVTAGGITKSAVSKVSGSGAVYTVTVGTGSGSGTIQLNLIDNDSVKDTSLFPLGGGGLGNGDFTSGEPFTINKMKPTVLSISLADANPTSADSVNYTVTFSEPVTGVDLKDFKLIGTGSLSKSKPTITSVGGSGAIYTVTASTGNGFNTGPGTLRLDLIANKSIKNTFLNPLTVSFKTGEIYTVDKAPVVVSIVRANPARTKLSSVTFKVKFSEAVTGVDVLDFTTISDTLVDTAVVSVSGSGAIWSIVVSTGTGSGTLGLYLIDDDTIMDTSGYPLGGEGLVNGDYKTGQVYNVR
ncbi:MAG: right-handed parallel beta-helix repeat-containing protein [Chloroflexi bacterium]|nr:right-handed parallel beta-helix repeat-containing protein [Chloroflexota bacterium]